MTQEIITSTNDLLKLYFSGKIVRKDLTKKIKEGANVPVYVLEYLLGMYCASTEDAIINEGVENVKRILAEHFVRPDESQKILSKLREKETYTIIDKITVHLNIREDIYEAEFSNLGVKEVPIASAYPTEFERLLSGGIWCIISLEYRFDEADRSRNPIHIKELTPIQMPHLDIEEIFEGRTHFSKDEWIDAILRSTGMEPSVLSYREKWLHLARLIPLVENNYNLCELGPRGTGKSHIYKEISPNSSVGPSTTTRCAKIWISPLSLFISTLTFWLEP